MKVQRDGCKAMLSEKQGVSHAGKKRTRVARGRSEPIDRSMIHLLHRASQRATEIFAIETRRFDLTARQYAVLTAIAGHEGLSQTGLVQLTGIDRSTLADVVQRLLKRGIIERERTVRDGRTYAVRLSADGRGLLDTIRPYARRAERAVLSCLGEEGGKQAASILGRLLAKNSAGEPEPS
jgi:DNA-binding MarR family transcriptional regulator